MILRGTGQAGRDRFWAEHAGAHGYVARGRMGDLVRAIAAAIEAHPPHNDAFFTQLSGGSSICATARKRRPSPLSG